MTEENNKQSSQYGSRRKWVFSKPVPENIAESFPELEKTFLQLLYNRGLDTQEKIDEFSNPDYGADTHDPFLFVDMRKAVNRIIKALEKNEKIVVYGDYDADGVCGAALLWVTLRELGAEPGIYLPYRQTEGYGLNKKAVESLNEEGYKLLITNDCGVTNYEEVDRANELGIDVIITDHHSEPDKLPKAHAILNPKLASREKYPFSELAGTAVAFKLAYALLKETSYGKKFNKQLPEGWEKWLLDLVAIATVADMMPMLGENRTLTSYGLQVLRKTKRPGLLELFKIMNCDPKDLDSEAIGFQIAPRLNSAGRLEHANSAFRLLVTDDQKEAQAIAQDLQRTNLQRQSTTENVVKEAIEQIGSAESRYIISAHDSSWIVGVLGLAAGRLVQKYGRPAIIMGELNSEVTGSGRSIPVFNMIEALQKLSHYFSKLGGHPQACGFTLKNNNDKEAFIKELEKIAKQQLHGKNLAPELIIDETVDMDQVNWRLLEKVDKLSPFGQKAQRPVFALKNVEVVEAKNVGRDDRHLSLTIKSPAGETKKTIGFSLGDQLPKLPIGRTISLAFELSADQWNGEKRLQLKILDLHYEQ
ncbi:MAG: single-stranded-DNA-specific exonuclease RecJ [bacterium]